MLNSISNKKNLVEEVRKRLSSLNPIYLKIIDCTDIHIKHAEFNFEKKYFKIIIKSKIFVGMPKIFNHRLIYKTIKDLIPKYIHSFSIKIKK